MGKVRIVCFGDSNTWGYNPRTAQRFREEERWTGILQQRLGTGYQIIEEGQNGRTIATEDPCEGEKNGMKTILPCIESQKPFDLLILMLGTNDLKAKFHYCGMDIAGEMELMLEKIGVYMQYHMKNRPRILLVSPPCIGEAIRESRLGETFGYERAVQVSRELAGWYRQLARIYGCDFLDASRKVQTGRTDSVHLEEEGHRALEEELEGYIRNLFV